MGHRSSFFYGFDPAPHRRTGRRSARRQPPRHELPARVPQSLVDSAARSFELLERLFPEGFELISDDHPAYRAALAKRRSKAIRHSVYPNPPRGPGADAQVARQRDQAMYPVDFKHKLWRHTDAHHRRETIAFGRRSNAVLARRLFPGRTDMPAGWMKIYRRGWTTPAVGRNLRHELKHAF
ncbi:MAG: hypothetical protein GY733_02540 [bacterium]|nr:hypothetical protein [bacterium]